MSGRLGMRVMGRYALRFVTPAQLGELINLYHLSQTALSGQSATRYKRMVWAAEAFHREHPAVSSTAAYKDLDAQLQNPHSVRRARTGYLAYEPSARLKTVAAARAFARRWYPDEAAVIVQHGKQYVVARLTEAERLGWI